MNKIAIIGAGVSGLTCAQLLKDRYDVKVFEKEKTPGGLIRCERINGSLFHTCGGHVFNSKRQDVLDWFWSKLHKDDFCKSDRNSVVFMPDGEEVPYPIENHVYLFNPDIQKSFIHDLIEVSRHDNFEPTNFEDFLKHQFGETLYRLYFQPYNQKVWRRDLSQVPLTWLEGKLPMPTVEEIIFNNINHVKEKQFVHSSFWYEKRDGSQLMINELAEGITILYNSPIKNIEYQKSSNLWLVGGELFDTVIFCGNIKHLPQLITGIDLSAFTDSISSFEYHGTTSVFCEIDSNPYSWIYLPSTQYESHRIICTGNFVSSNNGNHISSNRITATVEFTDEINKEMILENLAKMPLNPRYITHQYNKYTYPIQDNDTKDMVKRLKNKLSVFGFYSTGRFADWEYYNMDAAMGAAFDMVNRYL